MCIGGHQALNHTQQELSAKAIAEPSLAHTSSVWPSWMLQATVKERPQVQVLK